MPIKESKEKNKLETKKVHLGQYGGNEDDIVISEFEVIENQHTKYANSIGSFIISFAALEDSVDNDLANAVSDRAHEPGYRIIRYLSFRDKINFLKDNYSAFIKCLESKADKVRLLNELKVIYDKLCELSEFRNKVVHANWQSLDMSGFVRTKVLENKDEFGIQFEKVKMTPGVLIKFRKQNESVAKKLSLYREKVWDARNKEDYRRYRKNKILNKK